MRCEVLAPAGSAESLTAAVRSGADAVYMGMAKFNARRNAANFDDGAFTSAVEYCHIRNVRVYLTLNTLCGDGELGEALAAAETACRAGVDAFIVQDIGLARLLREACPQVRLHASTQMSVHSPSALPLLREAGFVRAVVSREMSETELAEMCRAADGLGMEIEYFVHGALCMSVSGQCYMSGVIGRRSGNRGLCAQPCRLAFADGSYPLSLKDLSLIDKVARIEQAGVRSMKIEGRMKRPEYVAAATAAFRAAADRRQPDPQLLESLSGIFSRSGHTDGYFTGRLGAEMFGRRTELDAARTAALNAPLHDLYRSERQSVPLTMRLTARRDKPAELTVSDSDGHSVSVSGGLPQPAENLPLSASYAAKLCGQLGGTPYYLSGFDSDIDTGITLPAASVKAMRRAAAEKITALRKPLKKPFSLPEYGNQPPKSVRAPRLVARFSDIAQIPADLKGLDTVYLPLGTDPAAVGDLISRLSAQHVSAAVEIPRALFGREENVRRQLDAARDAGIETALCGSHAAVQLAKQAGMTSDGGFSLNLYNSEAVKTAGLMGLRRKVLSFELTLDAAVRAADENSGIIAYGRLPLMLCRNCPAGRHNCAKCDKKAVLKDRAGAEFPVLCRGGASEILNSRPLVLSDRLSDTRGLDFLMLYFTVEGRGECRRVIDDYLSGAAPKGEFTRGLYYRGVL
jgi:putative protease